jgi:hypothetical protein
MLTPILVTQHTFGVEVAAVATIAREPSKPAPARARVCVCMSQVLM